MALVPVSESSPALAEHTQNLAPIKTWAEMDAAGIGREDYQPVQRDGAMVARESHNLEVAGSTQAPAPNLGQRGGISFSPAQVAALIGIAVPSVYRWIESGKIPGDAIERAPNGTMQIAESGIHNLRKCGRRSIAPSLSVREIEVLKLIADGKTYKEIGLIAGLSCKTVDCYAQRIKLKTTVNSLALLIRYAIKEGYVNA